MDTLKKFLESVLAFSIGIIFLVMLVQVFARVVLQIPTTWTVEFARVLFMFIVFFGSVVLFIGNKHMQIEFSVERYSSKAQKSICLIRHALILLFLVVFLKGSINKMIENWSVCIPTLEWMTMGYVYLLLSISALMSIGVLCAEGIKIVRETK